MNTINVEGVFGFCGIEVIEEIYFSSIHNISQEEKEQYFAQGILAIEKVSQANKV
jgi:FMN-dependent NADH-azoreductase